MFTPNIIIAKIMLFAVVALALVGAGCNRTDESTAQGNAQHTYTMTIKKSDGNTNDYTYLSDRQTLSIKELMENISVDGMISPIFKVETVDDTHAVVELMNVVNTQGKQWKLYINGEQKQYGEVMEDIINSQTKVEWKYE